MAAIEETVLRTTWGSALILGAITLAATPAVWHLLRLDGPLPAILLALCVVPTTIMGGQAGVLQGERRWLPLSLVYLAVGVPRVVLGGAFLLVWDTETSAMIGVLIASCLPVAIGHWALRQRTDGPGTSHDHHVRRDVVRETAGRLGRPARLPRALQPRRRGGPQRPRRARRRALRRRPDRHQGGALPAAVRRGHPLPVDVHRRREPGGRPQGAGLPGRPGCGVRGGDVPALGAGAHLHRRQGLRRRPGPGSGSSPSSVACSRSSRLLVYAGLAKRGRATKYLIAAGVLVLVLVGAQAETVRGLALTVAAVDAFVVALLIALQMFRHKRESQPQSAS
ncbi:hypothetical protein G5V59_06015 [Nocardioides sp. W3-2-3]|uniref:hypothetical protein n=1 Tax=Nocardioides convexus TaxID=2712224 RepID=UPI002418ADB7|nr:hypothetical protein [Nocardioides convexus]NGZ99950.1 hypothetical protein [Nocardioides convexus]